MLPGALRADLGEQERTAPRQTTAGIPAAQQGDSAGARRWTGGWRGSDAVVSERTQAGEASATFKASRLVQWGHCLVSAES